MTRPPPARTPALAALALLAAACSPAPERDPRPLVAVSVVPQEYFVLRIAGDRVATRVMIPPGASHATWEPGIEQIRAVASAALYVKVGHPRFPFEETWLERLLADRSDLPVVDSSQGNGAAEGDPHPWVTPRHARSMARGIHAALVALMPGDAAELDANLAALEAEIDRVDAELRQMLAGRRGSTFVVFHPAWGHFASEYGLVQLAIEDERKEPGAGRLARVLAEARRLRAPVVFAQPQIDPRGAEVVAAEIGARLEWLDPLAFDWPENLRRVGRQVAAAARP